MYQRVWLLVVFLLWKNGTWAICQQVAEIPGIQWENNDFTYLETSEGDKLPDFSPSGFLAGNDMISEVPAKIFVPKINGDATAVIQAAIDRLAKMPTDPSGFKGAVLLAEGEYEVAGSLRIESSGVVIRGSGIGENGTTLLGGGTSRETLIKVEGEGEPQYGAELSLAEKYIPLGTIKITLPGHQLLAGDEILIHWQSREEWIDKMGMKEFGGETSWIGWKPGDQDLVWDREITYTDGDTVYLEAPIMMGMGEEFGLPKVYPYHWPGKISHVGIENLTLVSNYDESNPMDEDHRWMAITIDNATDAWVRQVDFRHFAGSAVSVYSRAKRVTVEDCRSFAPVSEIAAQRRSTFYTQGQQVLFQRCYAEGGYHDFGVGSQAAGPNSFVSCEAHLPHHQSGGIEGWSTGALFDNVRIDGQALSFENRSQEGRGAGWTVGNSVFWQCDAAKVVCYQPPLTYNWAFGTWGQSEGNGQWQQTNTHVSPKSLFFAQLEQRLGELPIDPQWKPMDKNASTSPTYEEASEWTRKAFSPGILLKDWIGEAAKRNPISSSREGLEIMKEEPPKTTTNTKKIRVSLNHGRLIKDGVLLTGKKQEVSWWRGSLRKKDIENAKPHITRFVPGREGLGYTDILEEMVQELSAANWVAVEHNYGLWYDRRRDDHQRTRRMDADVWPPFYEQPFARSGKGKAWDGLSKYDLSHYNPWYWNRLKLFADLGEENGVLLIHQHFFQHTILEAGAHWVDSPWRPANNVNETGFPEPPNFAGEKRIFFSKHFYDVSHPERRRHYENYIRKGLDNFKENTNVLHSLGLEFTGPLSFVEFWLSTVRDWKEDNENESLVLLSATKDVQDGILRKAEWRELVDVIDIRYWYYQKEGELYAPEGGKHLAPRQHARVLRPGSESMEMAYRAVKEVKIQYPDKAVIYNTPNAGEMGWAVLFAGGSLPALPHIPIQGLREALANLIPSFDTHGIDTIWTMKDDGKNYLFYCRNEDTLNLDLSDYADTYRLNWIDPANGALLASKDLKGSQTYSLEKPTEEDAIAWVSKITETNGPVGP
ncbi:DUF6298 domain-containing protein [Pleomorphovibrio marinus]|uniref:DUF6298 domain-containing protein n=1 Tax=Pleomorphovibrio marinus TaxID=2164132 RepID=UPI000E0BDFED|nr:DUF6298 domain-containing protein [Pleomorphovibrio marinus]